MESRKIGKSHKLVVLYDGFCPVCRRSALIIRNIDILNAIELRRYQDFPLDKLPVPLEKLSKRIQACDSDLGNCREGIYAFTSILSRIPPLFAFAVGTYILGRLGIGQKFYDHISENRYNLPFSGISQIFMNAMRRVGRKDA